MPQQLKFNFKPREATPEEIEEWNNEQIEKYGKHQLKFVAFMSFLQILSVALMLTGFWLIGYAAK